MNFWHNVQEAADIGIPFLWVVLVFVVTASILFVIRPAERMRIRNGLLLLSSVGKVDVTGIVATSAVITAVIGLSFQDTLGNMMGGMALQVERAIRVGDWIRIDGQEGLVKEIRWRHTSIETRSWDTIVIPNSVLMKSQVTVLGQRTGEPRRHRQWVYFNVDFRYSPTQVIDVVETALRAEPIANIAHEPPPSCVLMDFKESYGSYAMRYWLTDLAVDDPTNTNAHLLCAAPCWHSTFDSRTLDLRHRRRPVAARAQERSGDRTSLRSAQARRAVQNIDGRRAGFAGDTTAGCPICAW